MDLVYMIKVETSSMNTGFLQYSESDRTSTILKLDSYTSDVIAREMHDMRYQNGKMTMTGDALKRVNQQV